MRVVGPSKAAHCVGPLEVGKHEDVEQLGAGCRAERIESLTSLRSSSSGLIQEEPSAVL